ncbi:MAG: aminotransferase class IV [Prolixibacteraceae bacterium]|nr:aminotransferase class IV [Prolixibacteraceae bacterium]
MNIIISNNGISETSSLQEVIFLESITVYEVVRIIDGIPLFLEDHFERLLASVKIQGLKLKMAYTEFKSEIIRLVELNRITTGNVKFEFSHNGEQDSWRLYFIPHSYPTEEEYKNGVSVDLLFAERSNPNAKVIQKSIRERANQLIADQNLYEVLLVNQQNQITEGSRSNVFFVKGNAFYTAPASMVLVGITRLKVFELLKKLDFRIVEEAIWVDQIDQFDAVFLTGTSPKVLPVARIGNLNYSTSNPSVLELMEEYNLMITNYIENGKR